MKLKTLYYLILLTLVASLIPATHAQTFSVLHAFTGGTDDGAPYAGVTIRGNALYGTTNHSPDSCGTAYQLTHSGSNWLFSTLAVLSYNIGCTPAARVVFGPDRHLYGTTSRGGTYGAGTVFKLTPQLGPCKDLRCFWTVNDLHDFGSGTDGQYPSSGDLIWDQQGNIYGTTLYGGTSGYGTVYELAPSGNGYTESVLYSFSGSGGRFPYAGLVFDNKGNLFGTTLAGGSDDYGTVFELTYVVGVGWTEKVLYDFEYFDGDAPVGGLIFDSSGNLYGTTSGGGRFCGAVTVFELSPSGDTWSHKLLHSFGCDADPVATLSMDGAGNLYGTTVADGLYDRGIVFKLSNTENGWVYTSLHDFTGGSDGWWPFGGVAIDTDGTLYGTTYKGGDHGWGTVWMIKP